MAKKKKKVNQNSQKKFSLENYMRTKMRSLPLGKCYMLTVDDYCGETTVYVSRRHPAGTISYGAFLIDKYCCGIKDAFLSFSVEANEWDDEIKDKDHRIGVKEISYDEAHNLIYGALAYAEEIGIPPHKDFELTQYILAEDNDDIPLIEYEFGKNGRPFLICRNLDEINYYKRMMLTKLKPEDFDVLMPVQIANHHHSPSFADDYMENPDDDFDGDYDGDWDENQTSVKEIYIKDDPNKKGIPLKELCPRVNDMSNDISRLHPLRKVAYFILLNRLAQDVDPEIIGIKQFMDVTRKAIHNFLKYNDVAFGEAAELLCNSVTKAFNLIYKLGGEDDNDPQSEPLIKLCFAYANAVHRINLMQDDLVEFIVRNESHGEDLIFQELDFWMSHRYKVIELEQEKHHTKDILDDVPFCLSLERKIDKNWSGRGVRTHVKAFKKDFVSKDPGAYYKRKIREALDSYFTNTEDFMGLVIVLSNLLYIAISLIKSKRFVHAYHIVYNILSQVLPRLYSHDFDEWILEHDDVRNSLSAMLRNAVSILTEMVAEDMVMNRRLLTNLYEEYFQWYVKQFDYDKMVDIYPLKYAVEQKIFAV